ncbi:MAG: hypothetical protein IJT36_01540 [Alphaproteobacteria bacterium]|nr:hypothetical protein [Alphaproteobacteria bacterium]
MNVYEKIQTMNEYELADYLMKRDMCIISDISSQLNKQNIVVNLFHNPAESMYNLLTYLKQDESKI